MVVLHLDKKNIHTRTFMEKEHDPGTHVSAKYTHHSSKKKARGSCNCDCPLVAVGCHESIYSLYSAAMSFKIRREGKPLYRNCRGRADGKIPLEARGVQPIHDSLLVASPTRWNIQHLDLSVLARPHPVDT